MRRATLSLLALLLLVAPGLVTVEADDLDGRLDLRYYGYFKLDAIYESAATTPGNYVKWVSPGAAEDATHLTANQTRLGLRLAARQHAAELGRGPLVKARAEIDFYGGKTPEDAGPKLRHAYLELDWKTWNLLIGQTSDLVSPLVPSTVNYTVAWWAGDIGFRRPQIRLTRTLALAHDMHLELAAAVVQTEGDKDVLTPGGQARVALTWPSAAGPATVGLSAHDVREEILLPGGREERYPSWSLNLDLTLPVTAEFSLAGELFTGSNLSAYLGAIGQSVSRVGESFRDQKIRSHGGWLAARLGPWGRYTLSTGLSLERVEADDLAPGGRTSNGSLFVNASRRLPKGMEVAVEVSWWRTGYLELAAQDSVRTQMAFVYHF